jgi:GMP synthase (glutamine-hydrolysing)
VVPVKRLLVVETGDPVPSLLERRGTFRGWIAAGMGLAEGQIDVLRVHEGAHLPAPDQPAGVVVTGSPAMVSERLPWSEHSGRWLVDALAAGTPVLGICYGHQLLAQALGGRVGPNPFGRQMGTQSLELESHSVSDPLWSGFGARGLVQVTHLESVLELPAGARSMARTPNDPYHAFAVGSRAWGVQFHPEFDAAVMRGYLEERRGLLEEEGQDADALLAAVAETPRAASLLARFAEIVAQSADAAPLPATHALSVSSELGGEGQALAPRLVLFDGVCAFCDAAVRWLVAHDPSGRFHLAPLQGESAAALRARHLDFPDEGETLVYVEQQGGSERLHVRSDAVLRICAQLPAPWRWLVALQVLPRSLRDTLYAAFARIRYRVFGKLDDCRVPSLEERARFLD